MGMGSVGPETKNTHAGKHQTTPYQCELLRMEAEQGIPIAEGC
jgi:hypothetical protein